MDSGRPPAGRVEIVVSGRTLLQLLAFGLLVVLAALSTADGAPRMYQTGVAEQARLAGLPDPLHGGHARPDYPVAYSDRLRREAERLAAFLAHAVAVRVHPTGAVEPGSCVRRVEGTRGRVRRMERGARRTRGACPSGTREHRTCQ